MAFRPVIDEVKVMDARIYQAKPMGLSAMLLDLLADRLSSATPPMPHSVG
jgi:hypothetical protein